MNVDSISCFARGLRVLYGNTLRDGVKLSFKILIYLLVLNAVIELYFEVVSFTYDQVKHLIKDEESIEFLISFAFLGLIFLLEFFIYIWFVKHLYNFRWSELKENMMEGKVYCMGLMCRFKKKMCFIVDSGK